MGAESSVVEGDEGLVVVGGRPDTEELFREHYGALVRLAYLLTSSTEAAEDLVQDVFAKIHRAGGLRADRPAAYLRTAVVNATRSWHRRRYLERRHVDPPPDSVSLGARELLDALQTLPEGERAVIALHYYEGHTIDEVAEMLGRPRGTVASWLHRGLSRLREVIER